MRTWVRPQEQGESFLVKRSEYQFSFFAVGEHFSCIRINNFCVKMILVDMHAFLFFTFIGDPGAAGLCEAVNVIGFDAELRFDIPAHFLRPGFGTEDAGFQPVVFRLQSLLGQVFADIGGIGRRAAENGRTEVHHELNLPLRIPRRHGERQAADLMGTAVQA